MGEPQPNSAKPLCDEILAQARRDAEELTRRANADAQAELDKANEDSVRSREERLRLAQAEASRRKEMILGTVPIERARLEASRREALLEAIHADVRRRLAARQGFDYAESLISLVASAISRMSGDTFAIKLSRADAVAPGAKLQEEAGRRLGRPVTIMISEEAITESGAVIEGAGGRQLWDNRLGARLERLWPQLRQKIAFRTGLAKRNDVHEQS